MQQNKENLMCKKKHHYLEQLLRSIEHIVNIQH